MVLLVLSPAWADDCPAHPSPERFHTRLEALVEPVAFADPAARGELDEILILLEKGCVQGPVPRDDIATVHLLRGSYAILADRNLTEGETTLRWAAQWGPPPATSFGPEVESRIEGMTDWGSGELDITFACARDEGNSS